MSRARRARRTNKDYYIAFDTETINGKCVLISFYNDDIKIVNDIKNFEEVISLILSFNCQEFWAYNLDFDIKAILSLYKDKGIYKDLFLRGKCYVEYKDKKIMCKYIKGKHFQLGKINFWDCYNFYQSSLRVAGEKIGLKKLEVEVENLQRLRVNSKKWQEVKEYCLNDSMITYELVRKLKEMISEFGLDIKKYYSSGYIGKIFLKSNSITPSHLPIDVKRVCQGAYCGARVECFKKGYFSKIYAYDIKSAYPYAMSKIPTLTGFWLTTKEPIKESLDWVAIVRVKTKDEIIEPLPVKVHNPNILIFPNIKDKVIYINKNEFLTCQDHLDGIEFITTLNLIGEADYPFRKIINDLYTQKQKTEYSLIAKLILNSLYGIYAERKSDYRYRENYIGLEQQTRNLALGTIRDILEVDEHPIKCDCPKCQAIKIVRRIIPSHKTKCFKLKGDYLVKSEFEGVYTNYYVANFITSHCRSQIYNAIKKYQSHIVSVATDCIFSEIELPLPIGEGLGEYGLKVYDDFYQLGNGIYIYTEHGIDKFKFRGIELENLDKDKILTQLKNSKTSEIILNVKRVSGFYDAIKDDMPLNLFISKKITIDLRDNKRRWNDFIACDLLNNVVYSKPVEY